MAARHGDELRADFLRFFGVHDFRALPAREAASLFKAMVAQPESWTHRAINPDWRWARPEPHLAALCADYLALLMWAKTKDAERGRNQPSPVPRPGRVRAPAPGKDDQGPEDPVALPLDQLERRLAAPRR